MSSKTIRMFPLYGSASSSQSCNVIYPQFCRVNGLTTNLLEQIAGMCGGLTIDRYVQLWKTHQFSEQFILPVILIHFEIVHSEGED